MLSRVMIIQTLVFCMIFVKKAKSILQSTYHLDTEINNLYVNISFETYVVLALFQGKATFIHNYT